ncbi:transporter [Acetobacter nitrogenifigens DSM 23921 = NBRC 105050]|uniref:AI-2E family transporter n=1 Tax=Acetobacter nitrogenifigens DSM 23921 = NBRC 105050 TaxID=1120919 RepID=A0A511XBF2_9PROT|nr:AI-2E family transporter [Acetobacter nitrogenifigens]GBQ90753.1 transporter [Acetobacter nitrogenifigens DSM 23921 = NBRC 105050]GEN60266.1 AI-2E family transporter [Acetobacter nitrogenifigens DSM 23921 = NBRC 105050]
MATERIIAGLLLAGVAYGCVEVMAPFSSALLWAAILAFVTWPVYARLRKRIRPTLAALAMAGLCAICLLLPIALLATKGVADGPGAVTALTDFLVPRLKVPQPPAWVAATPLIGAEAVHAWTEAAKDIGNLGQSLRPYAGDIAQSAISLLVQIASGGLHIAMALFIAFFFWLSGDSLGRTLRALLARVAGRQADRLLRIIGGTVRGTVYGVLGTAILQGVLTGVGFWIARLPEPVLFGTVAALLSVLPIGAPLVWIPAAIWLVASHHLWRGLGLAVYGVVAISGADHFIRPIFISRGAELPYLLTLIGVIGGVLEFGGLGIFLGPVLLAIGYALTVEFAAGHVPTKLSKIGESES